MAEYGLIEPFDTEDLTCGAEEAFAMGVEWHMFRERLRAGHRFTDLVLEKNAVRFVHMAERHGRFVEHRPAVNGWVSITVGDCVQ